MAQEVRLWEINDEDHLNELKREKLNLEDRLENWLEKDISMISDELLVIGRQVRSFFGGIIDILCLDNNGDVVIVELKRDKTPRDITAQVLDYATWVKELTRNQIIELANNYYGDHALLEEKFENQFKEEFPEVINESHKMIIVASEIDSSSERIIRYLSDSYGMDINAITFHYFQSENGNEYISRVYLIDPSEVKYKTGSKGPSKRATPPSFDEFYKIAEENGVGDLYCQNRLKMTAKSAEKWRKKAAC